jgi:NAD(P)-dependent dehydrogenase (short-subunit alcohol dehydrogenase family)
MDKIFNVIEEIVIITGASGQLGLEYTNTFLERGAKVVAIDVNKNPLLQELEDRYKERFAFINCDLTKIDNVRSASFQILDRFGPPTVLVNNAAIDSPPNAPKEETGPFEEYPESSWNKVMDVNVKGVFFACQVFGSVMAKNKRGSIINISSIYGVVSPDQSIYQYKSLRGEVFYKPVAYSVSKSALLNLTRYLAVYWAKANVRVNTLVIAGVENNQDAEFKKAYCNRIPIGRMASQDEYNGAMIFLASSASNYMTGAELKIDGGWTAI